MSAHRKPFAAFALLAALSASAHADAMFRGDAAHSGVYAAPGAPKFTRVKWTFHTAGRIFGSPAIANGAAFIGSTDGNIYAVDLATGAQKWKFATKARVVSSPAVANGLVFAESYDGNLYALDAATGALKWQFATGGERRFEAAHLHGALPAAETVPDPFDFYLSSLAVVSGTLYFGSGDTNVYALDAATGALKWKFKTGGVVHASPAVANGTVYIGSWDTNFYALDAATGQEKWRFKTGDDNDIHNQTGIQSSAAVANGVVYFGCRDSNFYALDAASGAKKWAFNNKGSWVIASPAVRGGDVYFATSDTGMFYDLDAATGTQRFAIDFKKWPMFASPAIAGDTAYIGAFSGKVFAIDLKAHKLGWTFETEAARKLTPKFTKPDGTPDNAAAYGQENFYDAMVVGVAKLLDLGAVLSSPVVDGNVVYVGSADGNFYALM